ncbi:WD40-repeat-containing domain protein [Cristinia sonorae]|uniref:WD40-repeat-containing domain protein n=1 Tax=Cristinia sonorae TaxID=1940300 RepID=A0A8K0XLX7_9AGAR|nr:WD40-repeat-containing domain protein [Cristinia sonorae]
MAATETTLTWTPPVYNTSDNPECIHTTNMESELANGDFVRQAKWCPDGSSALAQTESGYLQFLNLYELLDVTLATTDGLAPQMPRRQQSGPTVDFAWYPSATRRNPASFCFVTSVRECPVKLLDASDGRLRASYKIVDHRERQIAPHSLAFNPTATKLYCGFDDAIEVFDLHYPGEGTRLHTTPSKKSRDGLKGIISTISFASDISSGVYAAGSLNPSPTMSSNIALFSETTGETPLMFVGDERDEGFGIRASAMQVMFNPVQPYLLYASFRRHGILYCWDVRGDVGVPVRRMSIQKGVSHARGRESTNQKLRFDIDLSGKLLAIGDHDGHISMFDLEHEPLDITDTSSPVLTYTAHEDAIGSAGFHPLHSLLLSVSGSRHFVTGDTSASEDSDVEELEDIEGTAQVKRSRIGPQPVVLDNSTKLWRF